MSSLLYTFTAIVAYEYWFVNRIIKLEFLIGIQLDDKYEYRPDHSITSPDWTLSYRYSWNYTYD